MIEEICDDEPETEEPEDEEEVDEFYSLEELDAVENMSFAFIARKFPNIRFSRKQQFKPKTQGNHFNRGKEPKKFNKGGFKKNSMDLSTVKCFKCNEMGHFAND